LAFGVASIPTLVAAGIARVPWPRVLLVQLMGKVIWTGSLVLFGFFLGQYVALLKRDLRIAPLVTDVLLHMSTTDDPQSTTIYSTCA